MAGYQYDTSPRKYKTTYTDEPIKNKTQKSNIKKQKIAKKKAAVQKANRVAKRKIVLYSFVCFFILFGLIMLRAQVNQSFNQIQRLKAQSIELKKENDQLQIGIQNELNISNIEEQAKETLGMQKLTPGQTRYVNLSKKDYVAPSIQTVKIVEESIFTKISNFIKNLF